MKFSEEELRRQRQVIQQHLDWIDDKLGQLDMEKPEAPTIPEAPKPVPLSELPVKQAEAGPDLHLESSLPREYLEGPKNSADTAKIGCILIFVIVTLIPLFVLFGLPYLLE